MRITQTFSNHEAKAKPLVGRCITVSFEGIAVSQADPKLIYWLNLIKHSPGLLLDSTE